MNIKDLTRLKWTHSALDCYERGCICSGCPILNIMESKCFMKDTVLELVRRFGVPTDEEIKEIKKH